MKKQYFTVGPSQLFYTAEEHIKNALKEYIPTISHRSKQFSGICQNTVEKLRTLFELPDSHHIVFTGSATEVWERIIQNTVENESFHLVNGAFSEKFAKIAENTGRKVITSTAPMGECVDIEKILVPDSAELIAITHNETSTGAMYQNEDIEKLAQAFPDKLIALDMVSSAPVISVDWSIVDTAYFSVQKAFGLPAGLGVWIFNERCIEKCRKLMDKGLSVGSYHSIPELLKNMEKYQTPETPNVLNIYLLGKVVEDMLTIGMDRIHRETQYKAAVIYQALEDASGIEPFVKNVANRSKTTIVAEGPAALGIRKALEEKKNIVLSSGYKPMQEKQFRIANFPTHSKEVVEMLADLLVKEEF